MSFFDCSKAVPKICKADCCGVVPIPKLIYEIFKDKVIEMPIKMGQWELSENEVVLPITKSGKCVFLRKDFKCNIYDYRPDICKNFGLIQELQCPHLNSEGELRTKENKNEVIGNIKVYQTKVINWLKDMNDNA
jgi:Fe-S-cluster containining protein